MAKRLRIKEIAKEKGIKMEDLAKMLEVHKVTLSRTISGNPKLSTLLKIAEALDVDIRDLLMPSKTKVITETISAVRQELDFIINKSNIIMSEEYQEEFRKRLQSIEARNIEFFHAQRARHKDEEFPPINAYVSLDPSGIVTQPIRTLRLPEHIIEEILEMNEKLYREFSDK